MPLPARAQPSREPPGANPSHHSGRFRLRLRLRHGTRTLRRVQGAFGCVSSATRPVQPCTLPVAPLCCTRPGSRVLTQVERLIRLEHGPALERQRVTPRLDQPCSPAPDAAVPGARAGAPWTPACACGCQPPAPQQNGHTRLLARLTGRALPPAGTAADYVSRCGTAGAGQPQSLLVPATATGLDATKKKAPPKQGSAQSNGIWFSPRGKKNY